MMLRHQNIQNRASLSAATIGHLQQMSNTNLILYRCSFERSQHLLSVNKRQKTLLNKLLSYMCLHDRPNRRWKELNNSDTCQHYNNTLSFH